MPQHPSGPTEFRFSVKNLGSEAREAVKLSLKKALLAEIKKVKPTSSGAPTVLHDSEHSSHDGNGGGEGGGGPVAV